MIRLRHWTARYSFAVVAVLLSYMLRQALAVWVGPGLPPYITFYPAVMAVALLAGFGPGVLATALTGAIVDYWVLPPVGQWSLSSPLDIVGLALFTCMGLFMSAVARLYNRNRDRAAAYDRDQALRVANERFARAFAANPVGIALSRRRDGIVLDVNETWLTMFGHCREEVIGKPVLSITFWPTPEDRARAVAELMEQGSYRNREQRMLTQSGESVITLGSADILTIAGEEVIFSTWLDITELKQAQEALLKERDFTSAVLNTAGALVVVLDNEGRITRFNLACEKITGYRAQEVLGRVFFDLLVPQEEIHGVRQAWNSLCARDFPNQHENHWIAKDGTQRLIAWSNTALTREDGEIDYIIATGVDITEQKQAEEELRTTLQRFYKILSGLHSSVLLVTDTNQVEFANQAFCDYFGLQESPTELKHFTAREMIQKIKDAYYDPSGAVTRISQIVVRGEPVINEEVSMQGERTCLRDYIPLNLDGKSYGRLWHHWDITERKQAEMALAGLNAMLERKVAERTADLHAANQALEERAAQLRSLAGELTTAEQRQRRSIANLLHDGLQQYLVAARLRQSALVEGLEGHAALQSAKDVEGLLAESINVSRSLATELCPPVLDGGILAGLEWLTRFMASKHGLDVELIVETGAPILPEDVKIFLFESVRELLLNVVKHSKTLSAKVHLKEEHHTLHLTVADSGAGFDECALQPRDGGGGFGLFSIRERIGLVGGDIEIDSSAGKGARFTLTVPLDKRGPVQAVSVVPSNVRANEDAKVDSRIRILLVDDHKVMRESLALMLGAEDGFAIIGQAEDGNTAVELTQALHPRVVLMDINMPNMDGITATRIIARRHPDVDVIGLSLYRAEERADEMIKAGAKLYVSKSAPAEDLKQAIRSCVGANSAKVQAA